MDIIYINIIILLDIAKYNHNNNSEFVRSFVVISRNLYTHAGVSTIFGENLAYIRLTYRMNIAIWSPREAKQRAWLFKQRVCYFDHVHSSLRNIFSLSIVQINVSFSREIICCSLARPLPGTDKGTWCECITFYYYLGFSYIPEKALCEYFFEILLMNAFLIWKSGPLWIYLTR